MKIIRDEARAPSRALILSGRPSHMRSKEARRAKEEKMSSATWRRSEQ